MEPLQIYVDEDVSCVHAPNCRTELAMSVAPSLHRPRSPRKTDFEKNWGMGEKSPAERR